MHRFAVEPVVVVVMVLAALVPVGCARRFSPRMDGSPMPERGCWAAFRSVLGGWDRWPRPTYYRKGILIYGIFLVRRRCWAQKHIKKSYTHTTCTIRSSDFFFFFRYFLHKTLVQKRASNVAKGGNCGWCFYYTKLR